MTFIQVVCEPRLNQKPRNLKRKASNSLQAEEIDGVTKRSEDSAEDEVSRQQNLHGLIQMVISYTCTYFTVLIYSCVTVDDYCHPRNVRHWKFYVRKMLHDEF